MFRKQDFKKIDLLGSGKKHTKIYKVQHLQTNKIYALKEIEAKTLDKLNEYKEEAVQLSKVQNHPNVIKFFGYYFTETMYNTYRLGLITEYMDHTRNLEVLYRKKKRANQSWKENELITFLFSMISTCSFLQQKGICHRDIKPANLFIMENGECKVIDFGESKDYFYDPNDEDRNTYTVATIRGTPQYLSPILWKAHVIDGNSRYVEHNIYKSDVFSCGLVVCQMAIMNEISGFNNKTPQNDGEQLVKLCMQELESQYSQQFINILALMLIFDECNRPSFTEIEQLFIEHEKQAQNEVDKNGKPKRINELIKVYNQQYNSLLKGSNNQYLQSYFGINQSKNQSSQIDDQQNGENVQNNIQISQNKNQFQIQDKQNEQKIEKQNLDQQKKNQTQVQQGQMQNDSNLIQIQFFFWFEFGGNSIGKFSVQKQRWKVQQVQDNFPYHFVTVYIPEYNSYFLIGGQPNENVRIFSNNQIQLYNQQLPSYRNFFPVVYFKNKIFTFGGYDGNSKQQVKTCEYLDLKTNSWVNFGNLNIARSQAAACKINDNEILIFGGYNKEEGPLDSIEKYLIKENKFEIVQNLKMPTSLRRFKAVQVGKNTALILGGQTKLSLDSQQVYKLNYETKQIFELQSLEKGGIIENDVLIDKDNNLHIFIEHNNGTSPHSHIKYHYDSNASQYQTQQDI